MSVFDTRRFLQQKVKEANPDFESRSGSAGGTILIKPLSVMLTAFEDELDFIRTQLSLEDVSTLSSDNLDQLIANIFITRLTGEFSNGSVRMYFSETQDLFVPAGTGYLDGAGQLFLSHSDLTISKAAMALNRDGSLFFVDNGVIASQTGDSYNIEANSIVSLDTEIVGLVRVTNPSPIKDGIDTETDSELVARTQLAITVRNLINQRSIVTVLLNEFGSVSSVQPIGFRDPEMIRDIIEVNTSLGLVDLNIGGHADIYVEPISRESTYTDIPAASMIGEVEISTNSGRGIVTSSVKPGIYIDIAPGFFGTFEVEEQYGVALDPGSTYHIYLDANGVQQLDNVSGSFPSSSIPISIVVTSAFDITSVTDSRTDVIEFTRPMVLIDSVVELDPVSLTPSDRVLTDGTGILLDTELTSETNPNDLKTIVASGGLTFSAYTSAEDVFLSGHGSDGSSLFDPVNVSNDSGSIARNPSVLIDSSGKLHVLFEDNRNGQYDIHYARYNQAGSVEVALLTPGATTGIVGLDCDLDEVGYVHAVYTEGTDVEYIKLDNSGSTLIAAQNISATSLAKSNPSISTNGNTTTSSTTGSANGSNLFDDTITGFPGGVVAGQTLVLSGGSLNYASILDGTESEPGPFAAELTGTVSSAFMDTSIASANNGLTVTVDGVSIVTAFTDSTLNPIATVISEINVASLASALAASIASNSGDDEVVITSPTTGIASTINVDAGNNGLGLATSASDQGGTGYDTSVNNGNNTMDISVDEVEINVVFTDVKGNSLVTVISEINTAALASALATSVAFDGGGFVQIVSPTFGVASSIEVATGNTALGFVTGDREEGGNELGRRIGITAVAPTQITLTEVIRTISTVDDVIYSIESIESAMAWEEDADIFFAKVDDAPSVFVSPVNLTKEAVQASQLAVPTTDAMANGPGVDEITLEDTGALFITNGARLGDTVRVSVATPASAQGDYPIKDIISETEVILEGDLAVTPANAVTYEVFKTIDDRLPRLGTDADNETQLIWVSDLRGINRIELDNTGSVITAKASLIVRPSDITDIDIEVDSSDNINIAWIEKDANSGDPYLAKVSELGYIALDPIIVRDSEENSSSISIGITPETEPIITWISTNHAGATSTTTVQAHQRSAQDYFLRINASDIRLSELEDNSLVFTKEFLDHPIRVYYQTSEDVRSVEAYVQSPDNQIIDSNYITKHTIPSVVSVNINYEGTVDDAQGVVIDYINGVAETTLEASDISNALYAVGATHVVVPFTMNVVYNEVDGTRIETSSQDVVEIPRIARFLATTDTVTVTNVG